MDNENLIGFIRKLNNILDDKSKIEEIISLFPKSIIMPMFYKGDTATLLDGNVVTVTDRWKNGEYIYYFEDEEGDEVYTYESEFKF